MIKMPKSRVLTMSMRPLERLSKEHKDISSIQPLALRGEITTWQHDAKNCIRIYYRMVDGNIWSKRLDVALKRWAARLLFYAKELGFTDEFPTTICKGRPNILQSYWWIIDALHDIQMSRASNKFHCFKIDREIYDCLLIPHADTFGQLEMGHTPICALYHSPFKTNGKAVCYRSMAEGQIVRSKWVGVGNLQRIIIKIDNAVKRHRNPEYRKVILEKMRSKKYGKGKLRAGYRKA